MDYDHRMLAPATTEDYLWIVVVGAIGAFFAAYGIGANDVANAFATSVGSKSLTIKQAVVLAAIFEFSGALFLGSHVVKTIRKGIADVECFEDNPGALIYGMSCVVYSTGIWLLLASFLELPVSTTHSTVGGIVGMALAFKGSGCVVWYEPTDTFPYMKGVAAIVASWGISPIFSGIAAFLLFIFVRTFVLRHENSYIRSFYFFPFLVGATLVVNVFFIIYKGAKGLDLDETSLTDAYAYAFGIGGGVALLMPFTVLPFLRRKIDAQFEQEGYVNKYDTSREGTKALEEAQKAKDIRDGVVPASETVHAGYVSQQLNNDPHAVIKQSEYVSNIHDNAEKFDPKAEELFKYVQVFTAICDSFSHGANDVANAMGPFTAIYITFRRGEVEKSAESGSEGFWILALGGVGIVLGLSTYGYKIISAIGVKIAKITPSRGFAIELASAIVIIIGSRLEIPLSTTHCQVGATMGVALLEGKGGVNWVVIAKAVFGWLFTLIICGFTAAALFSQGYYAPSPDSAIDLEA